PHQVALARVARIVEDHFFLLAVDRLEAGLVRSAADDAERRLRRTANNLDRGGGVARAVAAGDAREDAVAQARRDATALVGDDDLKRRLVARPIDGLGEEIAVAVAARTAQHLQG